MTQLRAFPTWHTWGKIVEKEKDCLTSCSTINVSLDKHERKEPEEQIRKTHERKIAGRLRIILYKAKNLSRTSIETRSRK